MRFGFYTSLSCALLSLCILALGVLSSKALACDPGLLKFPITDKSKTHIRKGNGEWHAPRGADGTHGGVDLIVDASYPDNASYAVYPITGGVVVFSGLNGTPTTGYGNVIIVDHGSNCYSLYAHLANSPFTPITHGGNLLKKVGDPVASLSVIGYFVDIRAEVDSTGNARSTAPEARHQVHFELLSAPSGRKGRVKDILGNEGKRVDPTPLLLGLGYGIR